MVAVGGFLGAWEVPFVNFIYLGLVFDPVPKNMFPSSCRRLALVGCGFRKVDV